MRVFFLLIFFLYCLDIYPSLLVLDNVKLLKKLNTELIYEIRTLKPLHILIDYYEPITYSNFYNSQEVKEENSIIKGDYTVSLIKSDNYKLHRILTKMARNSFFMNKSYNITSLLDLTNFFLTENIEIDLKKYFRQKYFKDISVISSVLEDKSIISRIINTLLAVKKNFRLEEYSDYEISNFLNTLVDAYKMQKIDARIVHGYSIPSSYRLKTENIYLKVIYPMGSYHWIEIFLPNLGWLPIDPFLNIFFFTLPNLIRKSYGEYFSDNLDMIFIYPKKPDYIFKKETLFSEDADISENLNAQKVSDISNYVITGPIQISKITDFKNITYKKFFLPKRLGLFDNDLKIDMEITKDKNYSQIIFLENKTYINKVILPIYFLELTKIGKIWVEVENKGKTYRTEILSTPYTDLNNEYKLYYFNFSSPIEVEGRTVFSLKIANISAVFWYAIIGNIIGDKDDTVSNNGEIINIDFSIYVE